MRVVVVESCCFLESICREVRLCLGANETGWAYYVFAVAANIVIL